MACFRCGFDVPAGTEYCPHCGTHRPVFANLPLPPPPWNPPPPIDAPPPPPPPPQVAPPPPPPPELPIVVTDYALSRKFDDVFIGKAFAFLGKDAFRKTGLSWIQRLLGGEERPRVVSLLAREPASLPGATVPPARIPALSLGHVTSDKALYREGRDDVHLLALDPLAPGAEVTLEIQANGVDFAKRPARLDARGAAAVSLRDLPAGEYEIRLRGAPKDAPPCSFTVAAYRLAPLVASLEDRRLDGQRLSIRLKLESFGVPVDGAVQLELTERGKRLQQVAAEARGGIVDAAFNLSGAGPHAVNVQLAADPSRTATVPIVGSRIEERSKTVFSTLGSEVTGSLLPGADSRPVRGIYLEEGAFRTSPFRLERVDASRARLVAAAAVETARIVVLDPRQPARRPGAVDPAVAAHPAVNDQRYCMGEALFQGRQYAEALATFEDALALIAGAPHPNYAYYIACCHARMGDAARAVAALHAAIRDGWSDFDLLAKDEDLAALRGHPGYEALRSGPREIVVEDMAAGGAVEIDAPAPMAILAIGAWVSGEPWEGWAAVVTPPAIAPAVSVPERCTPDSDVAITVNTGRPDDDVSVYVIVKDARLLSPDTPGSRLAGGLKACVEAASKRLASGRPSRKLSEVQPPPPPRPPPPSGPAFEGGIYPPPAPSAMPMAPSPMMGAPPPPMAMGRSSPTPPRAVGPVDALRAVPPAAARPAARSAPAPVAAAAPGSASASASASAPGSAPAAASAPASAPAAAPQGPYRQAAPPPPPKSATSEPEVLFAGLVEARQGKASLYLRVGPEFADYLVEAFVTQGLDWAPVEARFRAEKEVFASLDVPAFVHPSDAALGRVHAGTRGAGARVRVTCDGVEVPLLLAGRQLAPGEPLPPGRSELSFIAGPGHYEVTLEDGPALERVAKDVDIPGRIRRLARAARLLEPGQRISRAEDPSIVALRVLPGLDRPFRALVDATADYGHACCEQTAAKMLAACAMYALAEDAARRDRAEAIILAGVRREETMWLKRRGFKMYPESSPEPNAYWGQKAARYLWNLGLLRELKPGRALAAAVDQGLAMAEDTTAAYGLEWPPKAPRSSEDAYAAIRWGAAASGAIDVVRRIAAATGAGGLLPGPGGAVGMRTETAYAAASLLRAGGADRARALSLANAVIQHLGEQGRLYSTVDSVAAIALMAELRAAGIVGGAGVVEVDGARLSTASAVAQAGEMREVRAVEGVTAVEVLRVVEEDWAAFNAGLPIRVALERNGSPTRRIHALDAIDLVVTLESGYKPGDLCWVCLPDALSRVVGGGQVKRFAVDFEGKSEVRIPLAATGTTQDRRGEPAPALFAVCVRNMFEEERGGNPGLLDVTVLPPAGARG